MRSSAALIFERSRSGRRAVDLPVSDVPLEDMATLLPTSFLRREPVALPEVSQLDLVRHFTELSQRTFGVDAGFYPLGSCTMKYNPKINEDVAAMPGLAGLHPLEDARDTQGALKLMFDLQTMLSEIAGMDAVTLQPVAGAHGELTGLKLGADLRQQVRLLAVVPALLALWLGWNAVGQWRADNAQRALESLRLNFAGSSYETHNRVLYRRDASGNLVSSGSVSAGGEVSFATWSAGPSTVEILAALIRAGGSRHVDTVCFRVPVAPLRPGSLQIRARRDSGMITATAGIDGKITGPEVSGLPCGGCGSGCAPGETRMRDEDEPDRP